MFAEVKWGYEDRGTSRDMAVDPGFLARSCGRIRESKSRWSVYSSCASRLVRGFRATEKRHQRLDILFGLAFAVVQVHSPKLFQRL